MELKKMFKPHNHPQKNQPRNNIRYAEAYVRNY
jgi:hypothetical protein